MCKGNPRHTWIKNKKTTQCSDFERLDNIASNLLAEDKASEKGSRDTMPCSDFERLDDKASNYEQKIQLPSNVRSEIQHRAQKIDESEKRHHFTRPHWLT